MNVKKQKHIFKSTNVQLILLRCTNRVRLTSDPGSVSHPHAAHAVVRHGRHDGRAVRAVRVVPRARLGQRGQRLVEVAHVPAATGLLEYGVDNVNTWTKMDIVASIVASILCFWDISLCGQLW